MFINFIDQIDTHHLIQKENQSPLSSAIMYRKHQNLMRSHQVQEETS